MKVVSIQRIQEIENEANQDGITFDIMFERVGMVVASRIERLLTHVADPHVAILVGPGNNGIDGLVTALKLHESGYTEVGVYLVKPLPEDNTYLQAVRERNIFIAEAEKDQQYRVLRNLIMSANLVVDAIFGVGVRLPLASDLPNILSNVRQAVNTSSPLPTEGVLISNGKANVGSQRPYVIALDCPSGVNCDTGEIDPNTLTANETITFIAVKKGLLKKPASTVTGKLHVATLGISSTYLKADPIDYAHYEMISEILPKRDATTHKGGFGKTLIVAGSVNYTGAAGLATLSAYRSGTGLVTLAAPMPVIASVSSHILEPTWVLLPHDMGVISEKAVDVISEELSKYDALLIGPGIGQEETTGTFLEKLLRNDTAHRSKRRESRPIGFSIAREDDNTKKQEESDDAVQLPPLVLDADALNLLAKIDNWHTLIPNHTVITPHPGEMAQLCNLSSDEIQANRVELAQEKAKAWGVVIVLKGAYTVIASPEDQTIILPFQTSALATAGTGDVLAGILVSLIAQGLTPYKAAIAAGYIHGLAGETAESLIGSPHGVIASDVLELVADVIGDLTTSRGLIF